ncbi:MAG: PAS domain S-box protein, partial [Kofleriaceae bacterium]|nr:PAS domain S-box protein [Kofleriaceae bacterium]
MGADLVLAASIVLTAHIGISIHQVSHLGSLVWAPTGISLAALTLWGTRLWPGVALGVVITVLTFGFSLPVALIVAGCNTLEAFLGALLLRRLGFRPAMGRVYDVVILLGVAIVTTLFATMLVTETLVAIGVIEPETAPTFRAIVSWGHLSAILLVSPVMFTHVARKQLRDLERPNSLEPIAMCICIAATIVVVFGGWLPDWLPGSNTPYYVLPVLLWTAVRFGPRYASLASLVTCGMALLYASLERGPFMTLTDLQSFIWLSSITTLTIAALAFDRLCAVRRRSAILHSALDAIVTTDEAGRLVELNPAAEQLFGLHEPDVLGKDLAPFVIPPGEDERHRSLRAYLHENDETIIGKRLRAQAMRSNGTQFPAEIAITRLVDQGEVLVVGFVRDRTPEVLAERALLRAQDDLERKVDERTALLVATNRELEDSETLMREAEELAQLGSFELDLRSRVAKFSYELYRILGRDPRAPQLTFQEAMELVEPGDRGRVRAVADHAVKQRSELGLQIRVMRADRSLRTLQVQGRVLVDDEGRPTRIVGCAQDVTDRVRAEEWSKRFFDLVESSEDAIIGFTLAGTIESWNAAAAKLFGLSASAAIGAPSTILVPENQARVLEDTIRRVAGGQRIAHHELVHRRQDGTEFDAWVTTSAIIDPEGHVVGISEVLRDLTPMKRVEQELRTSLREKDALLREVHHRVKNNLQVISSLLRLQVAAQPNEASKQSLLDSQSRIQSMALVHELLYQSKDFAHLEIG